MFTGDRRVQLAWRKTRWRCDTPGCEQGSFTGQLPAVKPRSRLISRLRTRLGEAVGDDLMPAAAAARRYGVSDRTAARAFTAYADEHLAGLDEQQGPVEAAGVDEFRRGAPADRADPETGEVTRAAPNGSLTWWISAAAVPWAWRRAGLPPPGRTCSPGTPARCGKRKS